MRYELSTMKLLPQTLHVPLKRHTVSWHNHRKGLTADISSHLPIDFKHDCRKNTANMHTNSCEKIKIVPLSGSFRFISVTKTIERHVCRGRTRKEESNYRRCTHKAQTQFILTLVEELCIATNELCDERIFLSTIYLYIFKAWVL